MDSQMKRNLSENNNIYSYFETPIWVSKIIAKELCKYAPPKYIIDMGAGDGALQKGFMEIESGIEFHSIEINKYHFCSLRKLESNIHEVNLLEKPIKLSRTEIPNSCDGMIISNPPYGVLKLTNKLSKLLKQQKLVDEKSKAKYTRKEIIFIARALEHMKCGSEMVFLVPKMIFTGKNTKILRETLFKYHNLKKAIILPVGIFDDTEIQTVLLFFTKNAGCSRELMVEEITKDGCEKNIISDISDIDNLISNNNKTLSSLSPIFTRGVSTAKSLRERCIPHIHSSDLVSCHKTKLNLDSINDDKVQGERIARAGDILISRVGSRCLGKVVVLESGTSVISDCVIRIKVPKRIRNKVFNKLISDDVQNWIKSNASGSCAKLISYNILNNLPI